MWVPAGLFDVANGWAEESATVIGVMQRDIDAIETRSVSRDFGCSQRGSDGQRMQLILGGVVDPQEEAVLIVKSRIAGAPHFVGCVRVRVICVLDQCDGVIEDGACRHPSAALVRTAHVGLGLAAHDDLFGERGNPGNGDQ